MESRPQVDGSAQDFYGDLAFRLDHSSLAVGTRTTLVLSDPRGERTYIDNA
jgi:hypothetical protein